jgi:energy-coupling factor transporter ATP-binding protein EcfA2/uncharacterized protein (UPF0212 family)
LVRGYPGAQELEDVTWLETWFGNRANKHFTGTLATDDEIQLLPAPPAPTEALPLAQPVRLVSIEPHFFRGFRNVTQPIRLDGDLVVIDGRNTSGKTSLAEALEWLFTGYLSRRESMELGSPHELENCITNQFCPDAEDTWVSGTFVSNAGGTEAFTLRRVLKDDYGTTLASKCTSTLFIDDRELGPEEESQTLDRLFASVPPLLMQHTLRLFVESPPKRRREYFERLLHLDGLTNLISKAVIGDARLTEFPGPAGVEGLKTWGRLGTSVKIESSKKAHRQMSRSEDTDLQSRLVRVLTTIARNEFPDLVNESIEFAKIGTALAQAQSGFRQKSFPMLARLKLQRQFTDDQPESTYAKDRTIAATSIREAWQVYEKMKAAAGLIGNDRIAIAKALKILLEGKVVQHDIGEQTCPVCSYNLVKTLSAARISEIEGWMPMQEKESLSRQSLQRALDSMVEIVRKAIGQHDELFPTLPKAEEFQEALKDASEELKQAVQALQKIREEDDAKLKQVLSAGRELLTKPAVIPANKEDCETLIKQCVDIIAGLDSVGTAARRYRDSFRAVEAAVGAVARVDPVYGLREAWLACFEGIAAIAADLRWEQAKRRAQKDLEVIRDALIKYREQFLESRRTSFNKGIESVWGALRADQYSSFSKLHIPPPSGKGFPVEIEVKAILDDGQQKKEVDALRVFSESQVNALGIAAFITRSKLLGHRMLIFDDPVQSMDEEHFQTFAQDVLTHVLSDGFQVIVLTHNDMFARDVSHYHFDRPNYVTMSVRLSRREGCVVEEGNRRYSERLMLAEKRIEDGNLPEAWKLVRLALERLYTVVYAKYGPAGLNPNSWRDQAAEYMWDSGAGTIIEGRIPGVGAKLKDILDMTAAGGHDKPSRGETDLRRSIRFLRSLPSALNIGG